MAEKTCERCGASKPHPGASPYDMLDYCAECSRDLCDRCMGTGCCGHVPALSGCDEDWEDDGPEAVSLPTAAH